jgi:hypothetical protein
MPDDSHQGCARPVVDAVRADPASLREFSHFFPIAPDTPPPETQRG